MKVTIKYLLMNFTIFMCLVFSCKKEEKSTPNENAINNGLIIGKWYADSTHYKQSPNPGFSYIDTTYAADKNEYIELKTNGMAVIYIFDYGSNEPANAGYLTFNIPYQYNSDSIKANFNYFWGGSEYCKITKLDSFNLVIYRAFESGVGKHEYWYSYKKK